MAHAKVTPKATLRCVLAIEEFCNLRVDGRPSTQQLHTMLDGAHINADAILGQWERTRNLYNNDGDLDFWKRLERSAAPFDFEKVEHLAKTTTKGQPQGHTLWKAFCTSSSANTNAVAISTSLDEKLGHLELDNSPRNAPPSA